MSDPTSELQEFSRLQNVMMRPAQQTNVDGSFDLGYGLFILCCAVGSYLPDLLPKTSVRIWLSWLPMVCAVLAPYGVPRLVKRFVTWPRTGYVTNGNDVTLKQMVTFLGLGLAIGASVVVAIRLYLGLQDGSFRPGPSGKPHSIWLQCGELLLCIAASVYLGRKSVTKRPLPPPWDIHARQLTAEIQRTPIGKIVVRKIWSRLTAAFIGVPVLLFGLVYGLIALSKTVLGHEEIGWQELALLSVLIASNAILYLMGNAVAIKQYRWKWIIVVILALGPLVILSVARPSSNEALLAPLRFVLPVMLFIGPVWVLSGIATLILFIRRHPLPALQVDERVA